MPMRLTSLHCAPLLLLDQGLGLGFRQFFSSSMWNPFDLTIVVVNTTLMVRYPGNQAHQHSHAHAHPQGGAGACAVPASNEYLTVVRWVCCGR